MEEISSIERQKIIKQIISTHKITSQQELVDILEKKYSINTNQSSISRDLRKLKVIKTQQNNEIVYEIPNVDITVEILKLGIISIEHNETMILINTYPGLAPFVGDCIDKRNDLNILGCIAGENVVFVSPKRIKNIKKTYQTLCQKLCYKK